MWKLHSKSHPNSEASLQEPPKLTNSEDNVREWSGGWLVRHHWRPRRSTLHPDLKSSELSKYEAEPTKT
eukprot:8167461-Prorocentrum_lima.AAC.1